VVGRCAPEVEVEIRRKIISKKGGLKMKGTTGVIVIFAVIFFMTPSQLPAAEGKFEFQHHHRIDNVLAESMGKEVSIRLESGGVFEDIITKVGDHLVHISGISSKEFGFDAYIRIDKINAVALKKRILERVVR
jgi:hypothetical protein